jgi:hypothetical protein
MRAESDERGAGARGAEPERNRNMSAKHQKTQYRQGDVLLIAVDAIPGRAVPVPRDQGEVVLAYGEVTGHRHAIAEPHAELLALPDQEVERRFLRIVGDKALLQHEEHDTITLPPGTYQVVRQREYVPPSPSRSSRRFRPVLD